MNETISLLLVRIQLVLYFFSSFSYFLVLLVSNEFRGDPPANSGRRNSIDQKQSVYHLYLKKLKQTTTVLSQEQAVRQLPKMGADQETVLQHLTRTMIENGSDLVSVLVTRMDVCSNDRFQNQHADFFRYDE